MKRARALVPAVMAVAACVAPAGPALARSGLSDADETRSTLRRVAVCAVDNNTFYEKGSGVVQLLESPGSGAPFQQLYLNVQDCMGQVSHDGRFIENMKFSHALLRGQIYRSIVLRGWGDKTRVRYGDEFRRIANAERTATDNPLGAFGVCVTGLDPGNALAAISSRVGSPEEAAAYRALTPSLSRCVAPGQEIKFTKQVLEGLLAEGLFVDRFSRPAASAGGAQ